MECLAITINCPDHETAREIADALLARRLVACANIHPPIESHYHWQGSVENAPEIPLVVKTRVTLGADCETAILALHPYEVPSIVQSIVTANAAYVAWIIAETAAPH